MRRAFLLSLPLFLLLALEAAWRLGAWETLAAPQSHSGQAISMKRQWRAQPGAIDVATLGSSRAVYGLDHAMLAEAARQRGQVHATFAMAGSHWMSIRGVSRWIEAHRPEVKRRVIALSVVDFQFAGNGAYELGIVEPLRRWNDWDWISQHVAFDSHDVATYGLYSSLLEYRGDMAEFFRDPRRRVRDVRSASKAPPTMMFAAPQDVRTMCDVGTNTLAACVASPAPETARHVHDQCRSLSAANPNRQALTMDKGRPPASMLAGRDVIVSELRLPRWRGNTLVVLMPTTKIWADEMAPAGMREWVQGMLKPLVEEGSIELLDYTDYFNPGGTSDCKAFMDLYHQNSASAGALTRDILEKSGQRLYR